jgi:hypothetical protein
MAAQGEDPLPASPDGPAAWQKLWHPAFRPTLGTRNQIESVRWLGDRFAIVGGDGQGAVVWWSDDGLEWARTRPAQATRYGAATSIAGDERGYVMIGYQRSPRDRARIWYSDDGQTWREPADELKRMAQTHAVVQRGDGAFVVYGSGSRGGCWMAISTDGGATWDSRMPGEWDRGAGSGCPGSVEQDGEGFVALVDDGIGVSEDGTGWEQVVSEQEIRAALADAPGRIYRPGLVPLGEGRFLVGGYETTSLVWGRDDGLELVEDRFDWTDLKRREMAIGPERAIAVHSGITAPLVSPPADVYTERWKRREPACRPNKPKVRDIVAMRPVERLECYGGRELTFSAWIPYYEYGGTCPFGAPYDWMVCWDYHVATGPGPGRDFLNFGLAPGARYVGDAGDRVRVTGHFDDPAAAGCPEPGWNGKVPNGWGRQTRAGFVNECRKRFIVTDMRPTRQ